MKKISLRGKFLIVFLAVGVIVATLTGISVGTINNLAEKYADIINGNYSIASEAAEMNRNTEAIEKYILAAIASEDEALAEHYLEMAQQELSALKEHYESIKSTGSVSTELLDPIGEFVNTDMQVQKTMFASIRGGNYNIARNMFFSEYRTALENVNAAVSNMSGVMNGSSILWAKAAEVSHFASRRACLILCLLCISIITFSGLYLEKALPDENAAKKPEPELPDDLSLAIEKANYELEQKNLELEISGGKLDQINFDLENAGYRLDRTNQELEHTEAELQRAQSELNSRSSELEIRTIELRNAEDTLKQTNLDLETAGSELERVSRELEHAGSRLEETDRKIESANNKLAETGRELESLGGANALSLAAKDAARCIDILADGVLDVSTEADYRGAMELLSAVNKMKAYLCTLSMQLNRIAGFLSAEAERAMRNHEEVSQGMERGNEYSDRLNAAINSLSQGIIQAEQLCSGIKVTQREADNRKSKIFGAISIAKRASEDSMRDYAEIATVSRSVAEIASGANMLAINAAMAAARAASGDIRSFAAAADQSRGLALRAAEISSSISEMTERFAGRLKVCSELIASAAELAAEALPEDKTPEKLIEIKNTLAGCAEDIGSAAETLRSQAVSEGAADEWAAYAKTLQDQAAALRHAAGKE